MRSPLAAVERFFERIFERQAARLFRTKLQPIQLQRRIERAMESERHRDGDRTLVPNRYAVHLSQPDLDALRDVHPNLAADLADAALAFARGHGYTLADRPTVALVADATVDAADLRVAATTDKRRDERSRSRDGISPAGQIDAPETGQPGRDQPPSIEHTAVFVIPTVESSRAILREIRPNGSSRSIVVELVRSG